MKVEALVFDMDGLLLDSERVVQRSWNYAGEKLGYGRIGEHIYHTLGFNVVRREAYLKVYMAKIFPMDKFNELTREKYYGICDKEGIGREKREQGNFLSMRRNTDTRSDLRRPPERSTQRHLLRKSVCGNILMAGFLAIR